MNFQKGIVKYGDRTDIECTYATVNNTNYYLLELGYNHTLPNGNMIASTELVEAIDPMYHASHIGVLDLEGKIVIPFNHRMIRLIDNNILLAELATPISENVVNANQMKSDPTLATKLVSTPALVKDRLNTKMNGMGKYVFNDQFSEATIYDLNGNNLIDNEYYSFISENDNKLYFSKNTVDYDIREYSMLPAEVQNNVVLDDSQGKIDVSEVQIPTEVVEKAMEDESNEIRDVSSSIVAADNKSSEELEEAVPMNNNLESTDSLVGSGLVAEPVVEKEETVETEVEALPVAEKEEKVETEIEASPVAEKEEKVETEVEASPVAEKEEKVEDEIEASPVAEKEEVEEELSLNITKDDLDEPFINVDDSEDVSYNIDDSATEEIELDDVIENSSLDDMIHSVDDNKLEEEDPLKGYEINADSIDKIEDHDLFEEDLSSDINAEKYLGNDSIVSDVTEYMNALVGKYKGSVNEVNKLQKQNDILRKNNDKLKVSSEKYKDSLDKIVASRNLLAEKSEMQDKKIEALTSKLKSLQNALSEKDKIIMAQMQQREGLEKVLSDVRASLEDSISYEENDLYSVK